MKTLSQHVLVIDNNCPLCRAYSGVFIKTGMLDRHGRENYGSFDSRRYDGFNGIRARNEIALVDSASGQVTYGIDSLLKIISHAFPFFVPLFRLRFFKWTMARIYGFISYNRKMIIPCKAENDSCTPDFNLRYRWAYIVFTWLVTSFILSVYSRRLIGVIPPSSAFREFLICGGQILFQASVMFFIDKRRIMTYLGNMMTVSFAGGLLLFLFMMAGNVFGWGDPTLYSLFFMATAGLMFLEHARRMSVLGIHWAMSATWVLYRVMLLGLILL